MLRVLCKPFVLLFLIYAMTGVSCKRSSQSAVTGELNLASVFPQDGSTQISSQTVVLASFPNPVDPNSVQENSLALYNSIHQIAGTTVVAGGTLRFLPNSELASNTRYRAVLSGSIRDQLGNTLKRTQQWYFETVDFLSPRVLTVFPIDGLTRVGFNPPPQIELTFSENMDASTLLTNRFLVREDMPGSLPLPSRISYSAALQKASLEILQPLQHTTRYRIELSNDVRDLAGNSLAQAGSWSFTTVDLTPPSILSVTPANDAQDQSLSPSISVFFSEPIEQASVSDASLYVEDEFGIRLQSSVQYQESLPNGPFQATFQLATLSSLLAPNTLYRIHILGSLQDLSGNSLGTDEISTFRTRPGWSTPILNEDSNEEALSPRIAFDPARNGFHSVWRQNSIGSSTSKIWGNFFRLSQRRGEPISQLDSQPAVSSIEPQISICPNGHAFAIWKQNDGSTPAAFANRWPLTQGNWDNAIAIRVSTNSYTDLLGFPQLATSPSGKAYVAYAASTTFGGTTTYNLFVTQWSATDPIADPFSGNWSTPEFIDPDVDGTPDRNTYTPAIRIANDNTVYVVWRQDYFQPTANPNLLLNYKLDSENSWDPDRAQILDTLSNAPQNPSLAALDNGTVCIAWEQSQFSSFNIRFQARQQNGTLVFPAEQAIDLDGTSTARLATNPQLIVNDANKVVIVFQQRDGASNTAFSIWSLVYDPATTSFSSPVSIDADGGAIPGFDAVEPKLIKTEDGRIFALWRQRLSSSTNYSLLVSDLDAATGSWSVPISIDADGNLSNFDCTFPQIATDPVSNSLVATWLQGVDDGSFPPRNNVFVNRFR